MKTFLRTIFRKSQNIIIIRKRMEKVHENTKNSIRLTIYNIKYYDSKSYTYLISK